MWAKEFYAEGQSGTTRAVPQGHTNGMPNLCSKDVTGQDGDVLHHSLGRRKVKKRDTSKPQEAHLYWENDGQG